MILPTRVGYQYSDLMEIINKQINESVPPSHICLHSLLKQAAEPHMPGSTTLFHCKMAFILSEVLASLLPCLLLSWPWVSQAQTMTQVLCLDCKESCVFPTFSAIVDNNSQWEEVRYLKKTKKLLWVLLPWLFNMYDDEKMPTLGFFTSPFFSFCFSINGLFVSNLPEDRHATSFMSLSDHCFVFLLPNLCTVCMAVIHVK